MVIAQTINDAINKYYAEKGKPVPEWKCKKHPDWWVEYLDKLGVDKRNP